MLPAKGLRREQFRRLKYLQPYILNRVLSETRLQGRQGYCHSFHRCFGFRDSPRTEIFSVIFGTPYNSIRNRRVVAAMNCPMPNRSHSGHNHHHHHHDNTYLTSANKKDAGVRITRIGLYVNLLMAISKGIGGYVFNSQALIADSFHACTDLLSDFTTLATVTWSLKPPTARFPSGYGKIESLGSLAVSGLLLTGGILMGLNSGSLLYHEFFADAAHAVHEHSHGGIFGHSHSHGTADLGPNINAAWVALSSIAVKEYLYRASRF